MDILTRLLCFLCMAALVYVFGCALGIIIIFAYQIFRERRWNDEKRSGKKTDKP